MRLTLWRWVVPLPAAFLLQFVFGLLFANGVFVSILHKPILTKALGLSAFFMSLGITAFGVLLHQTESKNAPRVFALIGAVAISAQAFMAFALVQEWTTMVYLSAALVGAGCGAGYVVSVVVLQAWVPESPAIITGFGLLVGGAGSLVGIIFFQRLSEALDGAIPAMAVAGSLCGIFAALGAVGLERPPTGWTPLCDVAEEEGKGSISEANVDSLCLSLEETQPLLCHKDNDRDVMSVSDIVMDRAFIMMFVAVCAAVGPGFGFVLVFPRMVHTLFHVPLAEGNRLFFWVTLVGVVGRMGIGFCIDLFKSGLDERYYGLDSAKRMSILLLAMQSMALASMPWCIRNGWSWLFSFATALVYTTFSGGAVLSPCLARGVFTPRNTTLAFALLGVAIGIGRALFSVVLAGCGDEGQGLYAYDGFVQAAFGVSTMGLVASYLLTPSKLAYRDGNDSGVFSDWRA